MPTDYREPKGLTILEAWANGVPVVQPGHGSFPELIAATEADPAAPEPHYLLAQVYRELHQPDASAQELAKFEKLSKSSSEKAQQSHVDDQPR